MTTTVSDHLDLADVERRIKAIFIGSVGNLVEWYDFYAYTAFALYFAPAFFPHSDPVVQQLNAAVLFAATFLMRPLGGWLFGFIADRYGRRLSLTLSVVCMCFGSLIIAVTPTYATIGIAAPAILALARIIEGLSLGGEYGASATYLTEVQTTFVIFGSLIFATLLQPIYGGLSDRIGRKPLLIFFGVAGTLATVPILTTLKETKSPFTAFLLICGAWIFVAGYTSINAIVKAELFPTNVRALGVGLPYAITVSVFGGTAPAVALYFKSLGHEDWFYYYLSGMICLSLIIYATMRDTKHES